MDDIDKTNQEQLLMEQLAQFGAPPLDRFGSSTLKGTLSQVTDSAATWNSEFAYRALIENLPIVTFIAALDRDVQELYISPQIEAMLGFTQAEWIEDPFLWFRQLHPEDRPAWIEAFAKTCSEGTHFSADYRLLARDGHIVWVHGECQLVRNSEGYPILMQGIAADITDRKRAEASAAEAQRAAESASRVKSEFLAHMSHEIRTPLGGLLGMIDLALATSLNPQQRNYLEMARQAGDALAGLVGDVLDFSKVEAGKLELESIAFEPEALLAQIEQLLKPRAAQKGIELLARIDSGIPPQLRGDPARLRQVLMNLTNNALKFTERGSITIDVALESESPDSVELRFSVTDTGIGIPADAREKLFRSFSQVDASTTRQYGGTGLGLAISKGLVELMGGGIGVESAPGEGSTFWFTARMLKVAGVGPHADAVRLKAAASLCHVKSVSASTIGALILVAEDNNVNQIVFSQFLVNAGFRCNVAVNGQDAVDTLLRDRYDLVLMDCQMPVMNGLDAARAIRRNESAGLYGNRRRVPIIALTANATSEDRTRCLDAGMDAFCTKPVNSKDLIAAIESLLSDNNPIADSKSPSEIPAINASKIEQGRLPEKSMPFDIQILVDVFAGDVASIRKALDEFENQITASIGKIEHGIAATDAAQIAGVAHDLKGVAGFFAADELAHAAEELEKFAKENDLDCAANMLEQIRHDVDLCLRYVPAARKKIANVLPSPHL